MTVKNSLRTFKNIKPLVIFKLYTKQSRKGWTFDWMETRRDLGLWGPVIGSSSVEYFFIHQRHFFMFWWVGRETSEVRCQVTNLVMAKEGHSFIFYSPQQTFLIKDWTFLSGSNYKGYKIYQDNKLGGQNTIQRRFLHKSHHFRFRG